MSGDQAKRREGLLGLRELLEAMPESWAELSLGEVPTSAEAASEEQGLYAQALDHLNAITTRLHLLPDVAGLLKEGQLDRFYFAHLSGDLATQLDTLRESLLPPTLPSADVLERLARDYPREPTPLLFTRGVSAYRHAASLLEQAEIRLYGAARESQEEGARAQLGAAFMLLASQRYIQPGLRALEMLTGQHLGPAARGWGLGPWAVLAATVEELLETSRRLRAAWECLSRAELETRLGIEFSAAASRALESLEETTRKLASARDRMSRRALRGLSSSSRLLLRLERMSRQAQHWREELKSAAQSLSLIGASEIDGDAAEVAAWLEAEIDGSLGRALTKLVETPVAFRCRKTPSAEPPPELAS